MNLLQVMQQRVKASQLILTDTQKISSDDTVSVANSEQTSSVPSKPPTQKTKLNRKKVTCVESTTGTYNLEKISSLSHEIMREDVQHQKNNPHHTDCFLPNPTQVAKMMRRVYETEFPHMDVNSVFVSTQTTPD
tara:strand:- start:3095 stop:3496 length:402 start_codon:yes stop_codon:yes gene_type:complete